RAGRRRTGDGQRGPLRRRLAHPDPPLRPVRGRVAARRRGVQAGSGRAVTHPFLALTDDDREEMLRTIGVSSVDALFRDIPAGVDTVLQRGEFLTAYTPYQPEMSQGVLQAIFEYQTAICELTGMDVSNASGYDGTTVTADACYIAKHARPGKTRIVVTEA